MDNQDPEFDPYESWEPDFDPYDSGDPEPEFDPYDNWEPPPPVKPDHSMFWGAFWSVIGLIAIIIFAPMFDSDEQSGPRDPRDQPEQPEFDCGTPYC